MTVMEVYDKPPAKDVIFLRLRETDEGFILLEVVDDQGRMTSGGVLLSFKDGGLALAAGINRELGLKLDETGRLVDQTAVKRDPPISFTPIIPTIFEFEKES